ncbi:MAG: helix-turn-helix domain-containing protein [Candidatus Omnitrophota bacterium]
MPEKLMSIKEVADYLKVSEEEVMRLVDIGEIPAYKIGGSFLRFRKEQIDAIKLDISEIEEGVPAGQGPAAPAGKNAPGHPYTDMEREIKRREPVTGQYDYTTVERVKDFFYFNDFYILSFLIIGVLMFLIFR